MSFVYEPKLGPDILLAASKALAVGRTGSEIRLTLGGRQASISPLLARAMALRTLALVAEIEAEGTAAGWWSGNEKKS